MGESEELKQAVEVASLVNKATLLLDNEQNAIVIRGLEVINLELDKLYWCILDKPLTDCKLLLAKRLRACMEKIDNTLKVNHIALEELVLAEDVTVLISKVTHLLDESGKCGGLARERRDRVGSKLESVKMELESICVRIALMSYTEYKASLIRRIIVHIDKIDKAVYLLEMYVR